jgi:hypothetical protein
MLVSVANEGLGSVARRGGRECGDDDSRERREGDAKRFLYMELRRE